jgi:hypothetical protein
LRASARNPVLSDSLRRRAVLTTGLEYLVDPFAQVVRGTEGRKRIDQRWGRRRRRLHAHHDLGPTAVTP